MFSVFGTESGLSMKPKNVKKNIFQLKKSNSYLFVSTRSISSINVSIKNSTILKNDLFHEFFFPFDNRMKVLIIRKSRDCSSTEDLSRKSNSIYLKKSLLIKKNRLFSSFQNLDRLVKRKHFHSFRNILLFNPVFLLKKSCDFFLQMLTGALHICNGRFEWSILFLVVETIACKSQKF